MTGRPNIAERVVLDYLASKPERVLDRQLDAVPLKTLAAAEGLPRFDLPSVIKRMAAKNILHPLQYGRWIATNDRRPGRPRLDSLDPVAEAVLRRLDADYYISWHSALWHYGLIDQQSRRLYVAVISRKRPTEIGMTNIKFVTIVPRKFFGRIRETGFELPVWMASPEKALIDSFDRPDLTAPMPVIANALKEACREKLIEPDKLVESALRMDSPTLNRRLGYFMDLFAIPGAEPLTLHLGRKYAVPLAPGREPVNERVPVSRRWRVYEDPAIVGTSLELK
jgi:predicted transcriptional regulator of viral defense system